MASIASATDPSPQMKKKWSNRFREPLDERVSRFNASVSFDKALAPHDIAASIAHARMLGAQKILPAKAVARITQGLAKILKEIDDGRFDWREADEDVHLNIERRLTELIGDDGKKLHTARSRNDQVATDLRLYLRAETDGLLADLTAARLALLALAEPHAATLMPGMTHLQVAQPVTFGHHLLAYDAMLSRDSERLRDARRRLNRLPLGAGALAGVGYPIAPARVARELGFDEICPNSMDAVSDRDFVVEFTAAAALLMVHLSRLCEELILWSSPAYAYVRLPDSFCTGSSIMPQKKNPDVPELIRGKCGRVIGALNALLVLGKSQPLAYNKDNQEDKEPLFDCVRTVRECVILLAPMLSGLQIDATAMRKQLDAGFPTATELADHLVRRGMPFREAHGAVSAIVRLAEERRVTLDDLSLDDLRRFAPLADKDSLAALDAAQAVRRRRHIGGTAPSRVRAQIKKVRQQLLSPARKKT